jgi:hypothetical protein
MAHSFTPVPALFLMTANVVYFSDIPGLSMENWVVQT